MFKFFLKKNFADIWDHAFHLFVVNMTYMVIGVGAFFTLFGIYRTGINDYQKYLFMLLAIVVFSVVGHVFVFAEGKNCESISRYEQPKLRAYFSNIKSCVKDGMLYGLFVAILFCVAVVSVPYYFQMWLPTDGTSSNFVGLLLMLVVIWAELISLLSLQWFIPIRNIMHNNFKKCLKKSYIIFFDNVGFSIGLALVNLVNLLISVFTLGMVPGLSGMQLSATDALRLRLYKYDWYEVNPGMTKEQRKEVPWTELLANDRKLLGKRTIKGYLFPWKE
ncbi:MAG: hypothetical protein IKP60_08520 [Treponema sp.]|nr:hypothetical protein [Treponema sp.]